MKTQTNKPTSSDTEKSAGTNQASTGTILQAYKNTSMNQPVAQLESYSETFTLKEDIVAGDVYDWGIMRRKLGVAQGSKANSAGANATASLNALGIKGSDYAITAHMIPRRAGGMGNDDNARPWAYGFENGTWKSNIDGVFDGEFVGKKKDETVTYAVETTDMDDAAYDALKAKSTADDDVKDDDDHKTNIQKIPTAVSASVGSKSLAKTAGPITNLIK
ncbi:MAG: hypothetical protein ACO1N0_01465 [Fluviicola sp.]